MRSRVPILIGIVLLLAAGGATGGRPAPGAEPSQADLRVTGTGCPGALSASQFDGSLSVVAPYGAAPPVGNRTVEVDFYYQENITSAGQSSLGCVRGAGTATTGASGEFRIYPTVPNGSCTPKSCAVNTGPFGPVSFRLTTAPPAGDLLRVSMNGTRVSLVLTNALASVSIAPSGPQIVSTGAPTEFAVRATAGDGGPSPATVDVHWVVSGSGWSRLDGGGANSTRIEAADGAAAGAITLFANGSYGATSYPEPKFVDAVTAVSTAVTSAYTSSTTVDAGDSITFTINGTGASGYAYHGEAAPGLGVPNRTIGCRSSPPDLEGLVTLVCAGALTYPSAGAAVPTVALTNGYSAATVVLPAITVGPGLSISGGPVPAFGYVDRPTAFQISVGTGSGTPPYGAACLDPGHGPLLCVSGGNGPWSISYRYGVAGNYTASLSLEDAAGSNRSVAVPVRIAGAPSVSPFGLATNLGVVGRAETITADLSGGILPAEFWWNDSAPGGTLAGGLRGTDGAMGLSYTPTVPGLHILSLTVLDGLGTRATAAATISVRAGPAVSLIGPPTADLAPVASGESVPIALRAVDAAGDLAPEYSAPLSVSVTGPPNGTGLRMSDDLGALPVRGSGFEVPASGWSGGYLNLSFSAASAGLWHLGFAGGSLPGFSGLSETLDVIADVHRAVLSHPQPVGGDPRQGRTLWRIADASGNPIHSGYVVVHSVFPGLAAFYDSPIRDVGGVGVVWVNYTALSGAAGTIFVLDAFNQTLLPPIAVPAAPATIDPMVLEAGLGIALVSAVGVGALRAEDQRRLRRAPSAEQEGELHRAAAGRAHLLGRLARGPTDSLAYLAEGWNAPAPPPPPSEVAEWLAALIAEGRVAATAGPGGRPAFVLVPEPDAEAPGLLLDDAALERSLARRERATGGDAGQPDGDPEGGRPTRS